MSTMRYLSTTSSINVYYKPSDGGYISLEPMGHCMRESTLLCNLSLAQSIPSIHLRYIRCDLLVHKKGLETKVPSSINICFPLRFIRGYLNKPKL